SNTGAGDNFANSVSISGDTAIIGAPDESSSATGVDGNQNDDGAIYSGAAYVFARNGTNWSQQAYLKASNTVIGGHFGVSVAVSDNTAAVSGDTYVTQQGGVPHVFFRNGTAWSLQARLQMTNASAVSIWGDTILAGAVTDASSATGINGNQNDTSATLA